MVTSSKYSIILQVQELTGLFTKQVKKFDIFCDGVKKNINVLLGATQTLVKDVRAFN